MTPESRLLSQIRATLGRREDVRLFRNNVGTLRDKDGRYVQYGLCAGSADLIGWVTRPVWRESVQGTVAVFLAIEVKSKTGRVTPEQENFLRVVREAGGIAGCVRSVDEALALVGEP